jgi:hypothetical protein
MNYNIIYSKFIESRPIRNKEHGKGLEIHHILPRSLGGTNDTANLITLTAKEHWIAHRLLYKMQTEGKAKRDMAFALVSMTGNSFKDQMTSRHYALIKKVNSEASLKQWQDPEYREKQLGSNKRSKTSLEMWRNPDYRAKIKATWDKKRLPAIERIKASIIKWALIDKVKGPCKRHTHHDRKYKIHLLKQEMGAKL